MVEDQADPVREKSAFLSYVSRKAPYQINIDLGMAKWSRTYEKNPEEERPPTIRIIPRHGGG